MCFCNPKTLLSVELCKNEFLVDGMLLNCNESLVLAMNRERVVFADTQSHQLLRVNEEDVSGIEHNQVVDLSDEGERWEGDVLHSQPFGWGVLYDKENNKEYEGFRIGNTNVCYGKSYHPDIQKVEYEGEWCEGKRLGEGILYDRSGVVIHEGEWANNRPALTEVEITDKNRFLHNHIEELSVKDGCFNE